MSTESEKIRNLIYKPIEARIVTTEEYNQIHAQAAADGYGDAEK